MSTHTLRSRRLAASALAAAADWLVEPAEAVEGAASGLAPPRARSVIVVVGLSVRCGATTVARALGAQLASRDPDGACAVTSAIPCGAMPLGLPAAARLTRALSPLVRGTARACGRLCLIEGIDPAAAVASVAYLAPLVIDVDARAEASGAAAIADHVVLVGSPCTEPALAALVGQSLQRVGPAPVTVLNRAGAGGGSWADRGAMELPESRMGARFALAGREPRGGFGEAVEELTDRCQDVR